MLNQKIPQFSLTAFHNDEFIEVSDSTIINSGRWSVFFFYPADFTFVCPTELEDLADNYAKFQEMGVNIYAVSTDTHFSHKAWHDSSPAIKKIDFPMIGDPLGDMVRSFGVMNEKSGLAARGTFLVSPTGVIKGIEINDDSIGRSADELMRKASAAIYASTHEGEVCPAKWRPGAATLKPSIDLVGKI